MMVNPESRMINAISFGVFCRFAPSTKPIMRSRKVSPGFAVMRMTRKSESTRVPPVTAERSPPDSRITGADSPVIADSSTEATPSITSPSPGIMSPGVHTTTSPLRNRSAATDSKDARLRGSLRRFAVVCVRDLRSVSACALPRPSAIASAKFANTTVNQSQSVIWSVNPIAPRPCTMSPNSTSVVTTLPIRTTNITGFRTMRRRFTVFANASRMARLTIGGSNSGRFVSAISEQPPRLHQEVLDEGPERQHRKEGERADDEDHRNEQHHEQGRGHRERAGRLDHDLLLRQESREREQRHLHREPADER